MTAARQAASCCRRFAEDLARLAVCLRRHAGSLTRAGEVAAIRDAAEQEADQRWREWSDLAAEVAARHEAIDLAVEQVRSELDRSQRAFDKTRRQLAEASAEVIRLGPQVGTARSTER